MTFIFDCIYILAAAAISPVIVYRMIKHRRYHAGWAERLGNIARKDPALKKCIWIHAVSVGEVNATRTIIKQLEKRFGDYEILISVTTDTGFARANSLFADRHRVVYFPLDFSWIMRKAFRNIRPAICLLMELEVWPNFVQIAKKSRIPIVIVNGRISDNSFAKYKKIKPIAENIFKKVSLILAQTKQYARRFKQIGAPINKVVVTGSLKYDTAQIADKVDGADELAEQLNIRRLDKLWVAGATGNDEEKILLDVYQQLKKDERFKKLRLAIIPRKPERFDEVTQLIEQANLPFVRYSQIKNSQIQSTIDKKAVILGDTMGDLRKFYSLAHVIFVGRTLVPMGGSDMAEAAALGKCTTFGPYAFNFKHTVDTLLEGQGAILVKGKDELLQTMRTCLTDTAYAKKIAKNGQEVIKNNQGATQKTIEHIEKLLR